MPVFLNTSSTDCPPEIDIAFLIDGSASVEDVDFVKMKTFVITIIQSFSNCSSQVGVHIDNFYI